MMAIADKNGEVQASIPGLARIASVSVDACRSAITKFLSPDPDSRTKDDEGRRIEEIDGGWHLLNHRKYREMASRDEAKEAEAQRKARYRAKLARNGKPVKMSQNVPDKSQDVPVTLHIAEAEADTLIPCDKSREGFEPKPSKLKKPKEEKQATDPRHTELIRAYCEAYEDRTGMRYAFQARDAKTLQTFLRANQEPVEKIMKILRWAWSQYEEGGQFAKSYFHCATIHDLCSSWPKIIMAGS